MEKPGLESEGLLRRASVEPDKHLSMHPALRAQHIVGSYPTPLAWLVRPGLPGVLRMLDSVSHVIRTVVTLRL